MKNPEYEKLLSPTPLEFLALMAETFGPFLHKVATFNVTSFILTSLGHGFDPNGSRLPEWPAKSPVPIVADEIEVQGGGFPVAYDGELRRSEPVTKAQAAADKKVDKVQITESEWHELKNYNPPLLNTALAVKIKTHWLAGKTDHEAALLAGCSTHYARHHRLAFEKADRASNPSPISE